MRGAGQTGSACWRCCAPAAWRCRRRASPAPGAAPRPSPEQARERVCRVGRLQKPACGLQPHSPCLPRARARSHSLRAHRPPPKHAPHTPAPPARAPPLAAHPNPNPGRRGAPPRRCATRRREAVYLRRRLGFVRVAIRAGADLVPVYHLGASQLLGFWGSERASRRVRMCCGLFFGAWGLPLPRRHALLTLVGAPVPGAPRRPAAGAGPACVLPNRVSRAARPPHTRACAALARAVRAVPGRCVAGCQRSAELWARASPSTTAHCKPPSTLPHVAAKSRLAGAQSSSATRRARRRSRRRTRASWPRWSSSSTRTSTSWAPRGPRARWRWSERRARGSAAPGRAFWRPRLAWPVRRSHVLEPW